MSNNYAFEITQEDIESVIKEKNYPVTYDDLKPYLDVYEIETAAMYGDDMDEQTKYAYEEIDKQIQNYMSNKRII